MEQLFKQYFQKNVNEIKQIWQLCPTGFRPVGVYKLHGQLNDCHFQFGSERETTLLS
jgi:hypothetical protein